MSTTATLPADLADRSPFWAAAAPLMVTTDSAELARNQVDSVAELLDLRSGDRVLELNCGANGNVAVALARRGLQVTSVASGQAQADLARRRAAAAGTDVRVLIAGDGGWDQDMAGPVVAAVDLGSPFGVADSLPQPQEHLARATEVLASGGSLAVLTMGAEVALRCYTGRDWYEHGDRLVLMEAQPHDDWTRLAHHWRIYEGGEHVDMRFEHRLLTARQLRQLVRGAGAVDVDVYGCELPGVTRGQAYDEHAERLLVVGRR